ncbi:uncharacterized protein DSM5745_06535 [Aspergillus mulundensis]|uniref:Carrier domain-containing protein n=1 Tax=Aspergillus mulundensis TaxID=1810919 RepID=A0A3D8RR35_9EURO|nr:hypothetical protein DSM5745_06535 [Aspergillus mulundensis]RDW76543.1 hypothetical protein DSM5745_06535 [Aspergillus mulundensis]
MTVRDNTSLVASNREEVQCLVPSLGDSGNTKDEREIVELDAVTASHLEHCSSVYNASQDMVLMAVWALVLRKYTGGDQQRFAVFAEGPGKSEGVIYQALLDGQMDFKALAQSGSWQVLPYDGKDSSINTALFLSADQGSRAGLEDELPSVKRLDLALVFNRAHQRRTLTLHVDLKSWSRTSARALASAITQGIFSAIIAPEPKIRDVDLFSPSHQEQLASWQGLPLTNPDRSFLFEYVVSQAQQHPADVAVDAWDGQFTYQELDDVAYTLATELQAHGVRSGVFVPVCFDKTRWAISALLAINRAGGAFVPCDPSHPMQRRKEIIQRVKASVVLTDSGQAHLFDEFPGLTVIVVPRAPPSLSTFFSPRAYHKPDLPEAPAYALFTSGSTGKPKACEISHIAFASISRHSAALHLNSNTRVLQFASYAFGMSIIEIFCTLCVGGTVCIPSAGQRLNSLAATMTEMKINWALMTPTVLGSLHPCNLPYLRHLLIAGEALGVSQLKTWAHSVSLYQAYGFTEWTGIFAVSERISSLDKSKTIGTPVDGRAWLVDPDDSAKLAPIGALGELAITGPGLATGYYGDAERTNRAFFSHLPWLIDWEGIDPSCKVYTTGDIMRYNPDGSLSYIERKDHQVKIRGMRVELGEVECELLESLPSVKRVVAMVLKPHGVAQGQILVAFLLFSQDTPSLEIRAVGKDTGIQALTLEPNGLQAVTESKQRLQERLPDYMVPQFLLPVIDLPTTVTGKIDRQRLGSVANQWTIEELHQWTGLHRTEHRSPRTPSEQILCAKVCELLGIDKCSMLDSFFELGGDSVAAMKLVGILRGNGASITVATVFRKPVLADLAKTMVFESKAAVTSGTPFALLQSGSVSHAEIIRESAEQSGLLDNQIIDAYPCTPLQEGLCALSVRDPRAYKARVIFELAPGVDPGAVRGAWERVVRMNDILRTRFIAASTHGTIQAVTSEAFQWDYADDAERYQAEVEEEPMGIGSRLVRACLVTTSNQRHTFILTLHHGLCDRWSIRLLLEQMEALIAGRAAGSERRFRPFIHHIIDAKPVFREFWMDQFENLNAIAFPELPHVDYTPNVDNVKTYDLQLPNHLSNGRITMASRIRLAWAVVLAQNTSKDDVVFGSTITGRSADIPGIEELSGPTIATVPLRVKLNPNDSVEAALCALQEQLTDIIPFEQAGLQNIQGYGVQAASACAFQSHLTIQPVYGKPPSFSVTYQDGAASMGGFHTYALALECWLAEDEGPMRVTVSFDSTVLNLARVDRLIDHLESLLWLIVEDSGRNLSEIMRIGSGDIQKMMEWNSTVPEKPKITVHQVFQERMLEAPQNLAICASDGQLTYGELYQRSGQLANELIAREARPGMMIPIYIEKSYLAVIAMLAVIRAGASIVLLDPSYPLERVRAIVSQSNSHLVICSRKYAATNISEAVRPLVVESSSGIWSKSSDTNALPAVPSESVLYLIFTSGSTGEPKGVVNDHGSFIASAQGYTPVVKISRGSRVLQFSSFAFDACFIEIFATLMAGGCVCVPSDEQRLDDIPSVINRMQVTHAVIPPSFSRVLKSHELPSLKAVWLVGEPVFESDVNDWIDRVRVLNGYGPAECAVVTTVQHYNPETSYHPQDIGNPCGCVLWVCDTRDYEKLVPVGVTGELYIEGPIIGGGYLGDSVKTAAAFLEPPKWLQVLRNGKCSRVYKTGDLVRFTEDGRLRILGRIGDQFKLRGQRIDPANVEYRLLQDFQGTVAVGAAIAAPKGAEEHPMLVGFVLEHQTNQPYPATPVNLFVPPTQGFRQRSAVARAKLQERLPSFMVPSLIIPVYSIPRNASGKLDRRRLQQEITSRTREELMQYEMSGDGYLDATTDTERELQAIWARVLQLPLNTVGVNQSFFSLGGDSITAMLVVAEARASQLRISITVDDMFRLRNIQKLSLRAEQNNADFIPKRSNDEFDTPFDLSSIQRLFFDTNPDGQNRFSHNLFLRLKRPISCERLNTALEKVVAAHPMLRARFQKVSEGLWQQVIPSQIEESFRCRSHSCSDKSMVEAHINDSQGALDIVSGPLFSADIFEVNGDQFVFLLAHHLAVDMISWTAILPDLETAIEGNDLPAPTSTSFQYWSKLLASRGGEHLPKPDDRALSQDTISFWGISEGLNTLAQTQEIVVTLDVKLTEAILGDANKPLGTKPNELLLAALLFAFTEAFPTRPVPTVNLEGHGREPWTPEVDLTQTVGWFTTLAPITVDLCAGLDVFQAVRMVKDCRRKLSKNGLDAFTTRYHSKINDNLAGPGAMEVVFNYGGRFHQQLNRQGSIFEIESLRERSIFDAAGEFRRWSLVDINSFVEDERLTLTFTVPKGCSRDQVLDPWISIFQNTLRTVATEFSGLTRSYTLTDFPLLELDYPRLDLLQSSLSSAQINLEDVETIYPCAPVQRGILLSQARNPNHYHIAVTWEVMTLDGTSVLLERVEESLNRVIARHDCFRTCFIETTSEHGVYDQMVLKTVQADIPVTYSQYEGLQALADADRHFQLSPQYPSRFAIVVSEDHRVYVRIDISHALTDATSLELIAKSISFAYTGQQDLSPAPEYGGYVEFLAKQDKEGSRAFWEDYLRDCDACLFPSLTDCPEGHVDRNRDFTIDIPQMEEVHVYCREYDVTAVNVFCLAWGLVLRSYVGTDSVCFGYLSSGRELPFDGADTVCGPLINMMTMRVAFDEPGLSIGELVRRFHDDHVSCLVHQTFSLAEELHQTGSKDVGGLFNTALSVQRVLPKQRGSSGIVLELVERDGPSEYAIALNIEMEEARTVVHLRHWLSCVSEDHASLIASSFAHAVGQIVTNDHLTPPQIGMISPDHEALLWKWNEHIPSTPVLSIQDAFRKRVYEQPQAVAVCTSSTNLSYKELDALSDALAYHLVQSGIAQNQFVPLCFEKSLWTVVALMAVIKAGSAFVLLDATHPDQRLQTVCEDLGGSMILASPQQHDRCAQFAKTVIQLGGEDDPWDHLISAKHLPLTCVSPDSPLCAVFTSGSTGKPKGAILTHGSVSAMIEAATPLWEVTRSARFLQFASYAFDASVFEMLLALVNGATSCILSEVERRDILSESMAQLRVSHCFMTPSVARMVNPEMLPHLKVLGCGGEPMTQLDIQRWAGHVRLLNGYGPAECSIEATIQPSVDSSSRPDNIGRAAGCAAWVVDPNDPEHLAPIGAIGELLVEGPIVGKGYLNNTQATEAAFLQPPSWLRCMRKRLDPNTRLYRTGDLVRYRPNGQLCIVGRKDSQIKVRGQRIELGEVEFQVHSVFEGVKQVAVELADNGTGEGPALYAFVSFEIEHGSNDADPFPMPSEQFRALAAAASGQLFDRLPTYMVPSYFIPLQTMPLNPSGKANRKRLRAFLGTLTAEQRRLYRPFAPNGDDVASPDARLLQGIWVEVLGLEPSTIGSEAHFFQLGGDSVIAMKVAASARRNGLDISVADIFAQPKLSDLARAGRSKEIQRFEPVPFSLCPLEDTKLLCAVLRSRGTIPPGAGVVDILPASAGQAFFLERPTLHHFTFDIEGELDIVGLHDACALVYSQFDILRTVFISHRGQILQIILDNLQVPFYHVALDEKPGKVNERFRHADYEDIRPLGTLQFAFVVFSNPNTLQHQLVFRISHAQWDGLSVGRLFSSVADAYHGRAVSATTPLSSVIYYRAARDRSSSLAFWRDYLQGSTVTSIFETPGSAVDFAQGTTIWENRNLQPSPNPPKGFTMATVVKAAWALTLAEDQNALDLVFGQTVNARSSPIENIDKVLGCCLNFIPVRVTIQPDWTAKTLLSHVQTQHRKTAAHDDIELDEITDSCTDWAPGSHLSTIVQHQNIPLDHVMPLKGLQTKFALHGLFRPTHELFIFTEPYEAFLSVQLCVNPNVMSLDRSKALHAKLAERIVAICERPDDLVQDAASHMDVAVPE